MDGQLQADVSWDPSLAVGHARIDAEHQELFRRFASLVGAMESGQSADIPGLFEFLTRYAVDHFGAEEELMHAAQYPGAGIHRAAHARFVRELRDLVALYEASGASRAVAVKTRTWIGGWLRAHIMGVDQAFGRFMRRE